MVSLDLSILDVMGKSWYLPNFLMWLPDIRVGGPDSPHPPLSPFLLMTEVINTRSIDNA